MENIERTRAQVISLAIKLNSFFESLEQVVLTKQSDFTKKASFLIQNRPELFVNLSSIFGDDSILIDLVKSLNLNLSRCVITEVGLSNLCEFAKKYSLPESIELKRFLSIYVFQMLNVADLRRGDVIGVTNLLSQVDADKLMEYGLTLLKRKNDGMKVAVLVDYKCISAMGEYVALKTMKPQLEEKLGVRFDVDSVGQFRNINDIKAISILTTQGSRPVCISVDGVYVDVGRGYYKQLIQEVRTIRKLASNSDSQKRIIFNGDNAYGFVKPRNDCTGLNQLVSVLNESNKKVFTTVESGGKRVLKYNYHPCLVKLLGATQEGNFNQRMMTSISLLVKHKLCHFANIGECECGVSGVSMSRIIDKIGVKVTNQNLSEIAFTLLEIDHDERKQVNDELRARKKTPVISVVDNPNTQPLNKDYGYRFNKPSTPPQPKMSNGSSLFGDIDLANVGNAVVLPHAVGSLSSNKLNAPNILEF